MDGLLQLQPLVHVADMAAAVGFYQALGGSVRRGTVDDDWVLIRVGGVDLGLLAHPPNPEQGDETVELAFVTDDLDQVVAGLVDRGVQLEPVTEQGFGRQVIVRTPDGLLVKINQFGRS